MGMMRRRRAPTAGRQRSHDPVQVRMAEIGSRLGGGPHPEFRARLRTELLAAYEAAYEERDAAAPPAAAARPRRRLQLFPQVLTLVVTFAMVTSLFATYGSVPGDTLYPLKRAAESTLLHLSRGDEARADRALKSAQSRAEEVAVLLGSGAQESTLIGETLKDMEETTRSAVGSLTRVKRKDQTSSTRLKRFAEHQRNMVEPMLSKMDEEMQRQASGYLKYIDGLAAPE
jgi:hypothetical protein